MNLTHGSTLITDAVANLRQLNFNDKASSTIVEGGTWTFYLHVNYQSQNEDLTPGKYVDLGLKALNDSLSSLRPVPARSTDSSSDDLNSPRQVVFVQPPSDHW